MFFKGAKLRVNKDVRKRVFANSITDVKGIFIRTEIINEVGSILKRNVSFNEEQIFDLTEFLRVFIKWCRLIC